MLLLPVAQGEGEAFDRFVGLHVHGDPLQGACFGDAQAALGRTSHRFYLMEQGRPVGALSLIAAEVGRLGTLLYAPRGPVLDPGRRVAWRGLAMELRQAFPRAFAFSCAPRIERAAPHPPGYLRRSQLPLGPLPPRQAVELPLSGDPERDLARLHRRYRARLRRARQRGVVVREAGAEEVRLLYGLMRQGGEALWPIADRPADLGDLLAAFARHSQARLFVAEEDGTAVAASVAICLGRHALCQRFGHDRDGRHRTAGYAAQWAAVAWAEAQGAERCDITGFRASDDRTLQELAHRFGALERSYAMLELPLRLGPYIAYRLLPPGQLRLRLTAGPAGGTALERRARRRSCPRYPP